MKVTFFDVEYANTRNKSICQLGILSRELDGSDPEVVQIDILVDPEDVFDENCVRIHGVTAESTKNAANFKTVWQSIEKYFTNAVVIGHNIASADLDALYKNFERYSIEIPEIYYLCTYDLARKLVPSYVISDYSLGTLCNFFSITYPRQHHAFSDACACSDLLDRLVKDSGINLDDEVRLYVPEETSDFIDYITNASLKKALHSFYGTVTGLALDSKINETEKDYIRNWRENFAVYDSRPDISVVLNMIDTIFEDGVVTAREINLLKSTIRQHLDIVSLSMITFSTQLLNGILKGMLIDDEITESECLSLQTWLYNNNFLTGHYPFDKIIAAVEKVLEDGVLTKEEADYMKAVIDELTNPVETLNQEMNSLKGKHVCLSGNFTFGEKSAVEKYIIDQGGIVDPNVQKTTDILVVGDNQNTNSSYGAKLKKAIEYNEKGGAIRISKERDIIKPARSFGEVLFDFIDKSGMTDAEVYKKAQMPRQMMSKIKCVPNYIPSKQNICAFAIALRLTVDETNELLASAGYVLSRSFAFDRVIEDSISRGNYDIFDIDIKLYELGISWLGTK